MLGIRHVQGFTFGDHRGHHVHTQSHFFLSLGGVDFSFRIKGKISILYVKDFNWLPIDEIYRHQCVSEPLAGKLREMFLRMAMGKAFEAVKRKTLKGVVIKDQENS